MQTVNTPSQTPCNRPQMTDDPCVKDFVSNFDPLTMTYNGDPPCVPPDRALSCATIGVSFLANIVDLRGDLTQVADNLMSEPFSMQTVQSIGNLF